MARVLATIFVTSVPIVAGADTVKVAVPVGYVPQIVVDQVALPVAGVHLEPQNQNPNPAQSQAQSLGLNVKLQ
jgi:hypothetical protein